MRTVAEILRWRTRLHPDRIVLCHEDRRSSYRQLDQRTSQFANALVALGIKPGDRVAVLDKAHDRLIETIFAIAKAGAVYTPVNWRLAPTEITAILNDAAPSVLIVGSAYAETVRAIETDLPGALKIIAYEDDHPGWAGYEALLSKESPTDPHLDKAEDDTAWQVYTSGTTGLPKGAEITHRNLLSMCTGSDLDYGGDDNSTLICLPLFHIGGAGCMLSAFFEGSRLVVTREFVPAEVLDLLETEAITHALFVPAMLNILLQTPGIEERNLSSLKSILYGASPIPEDLLKSALATFQCKFAQAYGLTETTGSATMLMDWEHTGDLAKLRSCGLPVFGHQIRIVDAEGKPCAAGDVGEITIRGGNIMKGYWNKPEETAKVMRDGWFHTGDAGYLDEDGFLYIHDRVKDMIVSGGENIYPAEVESALFANPDILDVAVIGVPDDKWGEAVKAIIVKKPGSSLSEADVMAFCTDRIARYKQPRSVDFVDELPRNPSGKILKTKLREAYWGGQDRKVN